MHGTDLCVDRVVSLTRLKHVGDGSVGHVLGHVGGPHIGHIDQQT